MPDDQLIPVVGCFVRRCGTDELGVVEAVTPANGTARLRIGWRHGSAIVALHDLQCGLQLGWSVEDVPLSDARDPLGTGRVVGIRTLARRDQVLVQLDATGRSVWLPYETLRRVNDPARRFQRADPGVQDHARRFRLRLLAHALENWNLLTGALDRLDVDPLPHQIQLVHRILNSGNINWLIADDVGLGKTIEVGLLLAALRRRGQARRVLVVAPSGLTRQWCDEMRAKFGQTFMIYGVDFTIAAPDQWKLFDQAVVSLDLAKREDRVAQLLAAPPWDIVIFDEAHKLSRRADGTRTERYRLAEALRRRSEAFILLSGTPHQGYADRFIGLLELVRPDLTPQIQMLEARPDIVAEMILRNRKTLVTDADGKLLFRGHTVHRVAVPPSRATTQFQARLANYLRRGYRAGSAAGAAGRAVGFVMVTYRKLASSSIAAIETALTRRLGRLQQASPDEVGVELWDEADLFDGGDDQDDLAARHASRRGEFFAHERALLRELLDSAAAARGEDAKLAVFLDKVVAPLVAAGKKLLVFTEYRATQAYLADALHRRFPDAQTVMINGGMALDAKQAAISAFNDSAQFMLSTEAGGEGINLHHACHVMVNYDLPWNPARVVQRIGRLYRYGQSERVVVFNLHAEDTFDNWAISAIIDRVISIAQAMAPVSDDYHDRLQAEIVGDLLEQLDIGAVLAAASRADRDRTREEIDAALRRAQEARAMQEEIFSHVDGFDPEALAGSLIMTTDHAGLFLEGMLPQLGIAIAGRLHGGKVLELRLPEPWRNRFAEFGQRHVLRVTTDRRLAQRLAGVLLLDFESAFFRAVIIAAKQTEFGGQYASMTVGSCHGHLATFQLRWQNDQGRVILDEFVPFACGADGAPLPEREIVARLLAAPPVQALPPELSTPGRAGALDVLTARAEARLASASTRFKHPNGMVLLQAGDLGAAP